MKYLCLVYHEETKIDALPQSEYDAIVREVLDYREELRQSGHYIASSPLQPVQAAMTLRVRNGRMSITDGPFAETREQLGGFYLIEARDLNDAIRVASKMPPTRLGCIEVRPIKEFAPDNHAETTQLAATRHSTADADEHSGSTIMGYVSSKDGTAIAFDRSGAGPAIIVVGAATTTRAGYAPLAVALATHFTVLIYDRRGRGDSGDTAPYAVAREIEDLEAVIAAAGGSAYVFGHSSGAVLALEAAHTLSTKITKLAMYEPPFIVDDSRPLPPEDYTLRLNALIAAGRRGDAFALFMTEAVGVPAEFVAQMRNDPSWAASEAVAHTLAYDDAIMGNTVSGSPLPLRKWSSVTVPTLVIAGGESPASMHHGAQALVEVLPDAQPRTLEGQGHNADPEVLAPVLAAFFVG